MALGKSEFRQRYETLAAFYDPGLWLYAAAGVRLGAYRRAAVGALRLKPGDTVVDLGCGTGQNFRYQRAAVGATGRIIGVDLTPGMLEQARRRAERAGWGNIELVEADMSGYHFPADADAVLATLALATIPDYDAVIARAAAELPGGARIADVELQWPARWPVWLARFMAWLNRPAGVTPDIVDRRPAEAIGRHFSDVRYGERYFGAVAITSGNVPVRETFR